MRSTETNIGDIIVWTYSSILKQFYLVSPPHNILTACQKYYIIRLICPDFPIGISAVSSITTVASWSGCQVWQPSYWHSNKTRSTSQYGNTFWLQTVFMCTNHFDEEYTCTSCFICFQPSHANTKTKITTAPGATNQQQKQQQQLKGNIVTAS